MTLFYEYGTDQSIQYFFLTIFEILHLRLLPGFNKYKDTGMPLSCKIKMSFIPSD